MSINTIFYNSFLVLAPGNAQSAQSKAEKNGYIQVSGKVHKNDAVAIKAPAGAIVSAKLTFSDGSVRISLENVRVPANQKVVVIRNPGSYLREERLPSQNAILSWTIVHTDGASEKGCTQINLQRAPKPKPVVSTVGPKPINSPARQAPKKVSSHSMARRLANLKSGHAHLRKRQEKAGPNLQKESAKKALACHISARDKAQLELTLATTELRRHQVIPAMYDYEITEANRISREYDVASCCQASWSNVAKLINEEGYHTKIVGDQLIISKADLSFSEESEFISWTIENPTSHMTLDIVAWDEGVRLFKIVQEKQEQLEKAEALLRKAQAEFDAL